MTNDDRVLVLMPTAKDGERTREALTGAGLNCAVCKDMVELCREISLGAGAALLTEEAVATDRDSCLHAALRDQPPWSDFPLVVLAREGEGRGHLIRESVNAMLVERPVRIRSLLSVLRSALRSRRRQYEVRDHLEERARAEEELRRKDADLSDFIENATVGLHWVGPDGTILWANRAELELLGYTREEYIGRNIAEFHVDQPVIDDILCRLTNGEYLKGYEARLRCKDGSVKDVLIDSSVLREGDRLVHTRCFTRDVTEQKQAEAAQARLAAIVESSEDAVISKTLDGIILSWNAGAERVFGYSPDEVIGKPITLLVPPELINEERRILEKLARGERIEHFETVRVAKGGRRLDISLTISPIRNQNGTVVGASKVARDITARRLVDAALRESEERFRLMADSVPVLVWVSDGSKRCTWFNKAWLEFTGHPMEVLIGDGWADDVHADDFDRCLEVYTTNFETRQSFTMDYRLKRYDGEYRWVEDNGVPRFDGQGVFTGYIGSCVDFTERKVAEEALRRLAADLSQADRKKDDFIALLAHELRNPLAPIRNGLQILRLAGGDMDAVGQARSMMDRQLTHMVRLIDDLLDVSRISRNKMELRRERVLLADVVGSAVETARPQIDDAGLDLSVSLPPGPVFLDADLTRLAQVISNLLTNSAKYTERGGRIWLAAERQGHEVVVTVRDNGIGIPAEALPNIFDMFSQVDRSVERSTGGLGIGLALVRGLVEMHGGSVTAESSGEGRGSTFTIRLPVPAGKLAPTIPGDENDGQAESGPKRRILVVDDNRDGAESLAVMLRMLGNEIKTAHDGLQAIADVERFRPEVILMDVGMPRLNGLEAARRIRELEWGRDIAIIALTGWGQDNDRERSREAGCDGHLVKPVNLAELEALLTEVCG